MADKKKRGWHGDPEGHSKAGKISSEVRKKKLKQVKESQEDGQGMVRRKN